MNLPRVGSKWRSTFSLFVSHVYHVRAIVDDCAIIVRTWDRSKQRWRYHVATARDFHPKHGQYEPVRKAR